MFCAQVEELFSEERPIVWLGESGFAHDMPRTHGYAVKGKRCYGKHDWGAKGRTNVIGALVGRRLLTVGLVSGSVNTEPFTCWVTQDLVSQLPKNSVVIMDNATFHKGEAMKLALTSLGHTLLYLPPYSP